MEQSPMQTFESFDKKVLQTLQEMHSKNLVEMEISGETNIRIFSEDYPDIQNKIDTEGCVVKTTPHEGKNYYICTF